MTNKMTPDQARTFSAQSDANATYLRSVFPCGCEPYQDIFTFNRWKAQGLFVKKGEKGKRITTYTEKVVEAADGTSHTTRFPRTVAVFCRCQVQPPTPKEVK
jgi:hypothetical protein